MNDQKRVKIKVYQTGMYRIRATYEFTVPCDTTLKALYAMIANKVNDTWQTRNIAATLEAYNPSEIGRLTYPGRVFKSDHPDATARFKLDKSNSSKTIVECGITDGAELMYDNGEMD